MTGPARGGQWWEQEPERKLSGIVLPSWGDDDSWDEDPAVRADRNRADGNADPQRLVPVVPAGPPPAWPPADEPQALVELPKFEPLPAGDSAELFAAAPPAWESAALVGAAPHATDPAAPAAAEPGAPRREFPRYIAGELVLPGTAPASTPTVTPDRATDRATDTATDTATAAAHTGDVPAGVAETQTGRTPLLDLPAAAPTWAPQPTWHAPDEPAEDRPQLPGVQFTAPPKPKPSPHSTAAPRTAAPATEPAAPPAAGQQRHLPPAPQPPTPQPPTPQPSPPAAGPGPAAARQQQPPQPLTLPAAAVPPPPPVPPPHPAEQVTAAQPAVPAAVHAAAQQPAAEADAVHPRQKPKGGLRTAPPHPAFPEATARTMRILPIAADLLPPEITDSRRLHKVRGLVLTGLTAVLALLLIWYGTAYLQARRAETDLAGVQKLNQQLENRKVQYKELTKARTDKKLIEDQLKLILAQDLPWSTLLAALQQATPSTSVKVDSVTGSLSIASGVTPGSDPNVIGLITLTGTAPSKKDVATYVDRLGGVPGIANPFPTDATQGDNGVGFTIRMDITKAALGGRFTSPSPSPSATGGK